MRILCSVSGYVMPVMSHEATLWLVSRSQPLTPVGEGLGTCNTWSCSTGMHSLLHVTLRLTLRSARLPSISM